MTTVKLHAILMAQIQNHLSSRRAPHIKINILNYPKQKLFQYLVILIVCSDVYRSDWNRLLMSSGEAPFWFAVLPGVSGYGFNVVKKIFVA